MSPSTTRPTELLPSQAPRPRHLKDGRYFPEPSRTSKVFCAAGDFPLDFTHVHINIKDTFPFQAVLRLSVDNQTEYRRSVTTNIHVHNTTMFHSVKEDRAKSARIHELVAQLFSRDSMQTLPSSFVGYTQRIKQTTWTPWPVVGATTAFGSTMRHLVAFSSNVVVSLAGSGFVLLLFFSH